MDNFLQQMAGCKEDLEGLIEAKREEVYFQRILANLNEQLSQKDSEIQRLKGLIEAEIERFGELQREKESIEVLFDKSHAECMDLIFKLAEQKNENAILISLKNNKTT